MLLIVLMGMIGLEAVIEAAIVVIHFDLHHRLRRHAGRPPPLQHLQKSRNGRVCRTGRPLP